MRLRTISIGAALIASACAACANSTPSAAPRPNPAATSPATTMGAASTSATTTADGLSTDNAVPGANYTALHPGPNQPAERGGDQLGVLGFTPDGLAITAVFQRPTGEELTPGHIELIQPGADHGQVLPEVRGTEPTQIVGAVADANTVAWVETATTDGAIDQWVIEAYDPNTHQTRVVARAANHEDTIRGVGDQMLFLSDGRLYWNLAVWLGSTHPGYRNVMYSADPRSGVAREEMTNVEQMAASGDDLFYVKSHADDSTIPTGQIRIHRRDLSTGGDTVIQTLNLADGETFGSLASSGGDVAWTISTQAANQARLSASLTIRQSSGAVTTITGAGVYFGNLVLTPDFAIWTGDSQPGQNWLFDRNRGTVVNLGNSPDRIDVHGAGSTLLRNDAAGDQLTATLEQ